MSGFSFTKPIEKVDFFAVLPTGAYILAVVTLCIWTASEPKPCTLTFKEAIAVLADTFKSNPFYFIIALFGAYLLGSVIRAFHVSWAEKVTPPFTANFPYQNTLIKAIDKLKDNAAAAQIDVTKLPDLSAGVSGYIFNYWKDALCSKADRGFEYYRNYEARARFSAGMVWAGMAGIAGGLYVVFISRTMGLQVVLFSAIIYIAFGFQLRRVRVQEAKVLLFLYAAHLQ